LEIALGVSHLMCRLVCDLIALSVLSLVCRRQCVDTPTSYVVGCREVFIVVGIVSFPIGIERGVNGYLGFIFIVCILNVAVKCLFLSGW
jgi:hypothetical protein